MQLSRRGFIGGLGALIAAPAIVRAASLMPVRGIVMDVYGRSPAMDALSAIRDMNVLLYGDPDAHPMQFTGLIPA